MKLIVRPEAEEELIEAIDWYEARSPGLGGDSFVASMPAFNGYFDFPKPIPMFIGPFGWR